ncbi:MAG: sodium:calcium antiporter [Desulfobacterales bacterium]
MTLLRWIADESLLHHFVAGLSTFILLILVAVCVALLSKGADWMVDGVVDLARRTGMSKIAIGATIVSLGTTTPEAFVSVMAAFMGNPGLALGNGVGSIIADTGLIFGLTCILARVPLNRFILSRTGWVQVGAATLLVIIALASRTLSGGAPVLGRGVGIFLLILLAAYLYATFLWSKQASTLFPDSDEAGAAMRSLLTCWLMLLGGLFLVVAGARVLVPCASEVALRFGVPEDVIAATMVAFGTSLPELITAMAAVRKGYPEITVGNVVGADVLNCLFVIGAAATAQPLAVPPTFFYFHFPAMLIILWSFRLFITLNKDGNFKRYQGFWLLGIYVLYVTLQFTLNTGG